MKTIARLREANPLDTTQRVKVSRAEVYWIMVESSLLAGNDAALDETPLWLTGAELTVRFPVLSAHLDEVCAAGLIQPSGEEFLIRSPALLALVADGANDGVPLADMLTLPPPCAARSQCWRQPSRTSSRPADPPAAACRAGAIGASSAAARAPAADPGRRQHPADQLGAALLRRG